MDYKLDKKSISFKPTNLLYMRSLLLKSEWIFNILAFLREFSGNKQSKAQNYVTLWRFCEEITSSSKLYASNNNGWHLFVQLRQFAATKHKFPQISIHNISIVHFHFLFLKLQRVKRVLNARVVEYFAGIWFLWLLVSMEMLNIGNIRRRICYSLSAIRQFRPP